MRYQPNFCNNCGEKIERPTPSVTDSTRFCDVCKHDFVPLRAVPFVFAALMTVFGMFGLGFYLQRGGEKSLNVSPRQLAANPSGAVKKPAGNASPPSLNTNAAPTAQTGNLQTNAPPSNLKVKPPPRLNAPVSTDETVYFCGAATKKGTPCSRRVRGGGRCWQHKGQTALLPDEKLLVSQ